MTITYVDTSTLIKLLVSEVGTTEAQAIWDRADGVASASILQVEARAALAAAARGHRITAEQHKQAKKHLQGLLADVDAIDLTDDLLDVAADLAENETLRGYDAVHLAAALEAEVDVLTSADRDLCDAAARNGIAVANPLDLHLDDEDRPG